MIFEKDVHVPGNKPYVLNKARGTTYLVFKVASGDQVEKGQVVAVISAMKMEMAVQAGVSGKVSKIGVAKGDKVEGDDLMMEIEE